MYWRLCGSRDGSTPLDTYLTVSPDHGAEKLPRASPSVHAHHPQDLEEAEATDDGGREVLLRASYYQRRDASHDEHHVCRTDTGCDKSCHNMSTACYYICCL